MRDQFRLSKFLKLIRLSKFLKLGKSTGNPTAEPITCFKSEVIIP